MHFPFGEPVTDFTVVDIDDQHDHAMDDRRDSSHIRVLVEHSTRLTILGHTLDVDTGVVRVHVATEVEGQDQHTKGHHH